jgi:hypothetical protein
MGFFSGNCVHCKHSILSDNALTQALFDNGGVALTRIVLLRENLFVIGMYDGYGRIYDENHSTIVEEVFYYDEDTVFHEHCWRKVGCPMWSEELPISSSSEDQGFFIEEHKYLNLLNQWKEENLK